MQTIIAVQEQTSEKEALGKQTPARLKQKSCLYSSTASMNISSFIFLKKNLISQQIIWKLVFAAVAEWGRSELSIF